MRPVDPALFLAHGSRNLQPDFERARAEALQADRAEVLRVLRGRNMLPPMHRWFTNGWLPNDPAPVGSCMIGDDPWAPTASLANVVPVGSIREEMNSLSYAYRWRPRHRLSGMLTGRID